MIPYHERSCTTEWFYFTNDLCCTGCIPPMRDLSLVVFHQWETLYWFILTNDWSCTGCTPTNVRPCTCEYAESTPELPVVPRGPACTLTLPYNRQVVPTKPTTLQTSDRIRWKKRELREKIREKGRELPLDCPDYYTWPLNYLSCTHHPPKTITMLTPAPSQIPVRGTNVHVHNSISPNSLAQLVKTIPRVLSTFLPGYWRLFYLH